jgi:hypothetical protein
MESSNEKKGRFPKTSNNFASMLLRVKGTLGGKNIIEKIGLWNEKQYDISNL